MASLSDKKHAGLASHLRGTSAAVDLNIIRHTYSNGVSTICN